ncbi:unnamed protein product, partial [Closterium sp. Naga37s-1]
MMARLHGRVVARRSGLVFAALAALMLSGVLSCSWLCAHLLSFTPPSSNSPPPLSPISQPHHFFRFKEALSCNLCVQTPPLFSPCAPRTAAVRLPAASNAPDHSCVQRNCGANAVCVKDRGSATCVCNVGFSMTPTGCVGESLLLVCSAGGDCCCSELCCDTCALKACGGNATCIKDSAGVASCVCRAGFVLQADKKTCTDTCVLKRCGGNAKCVKSAAGVAFCVCDTGFVLQPDGVTCTDACALKACGGNGTCIKDGTTGVASCVCDTGFVLQPDGITCTVGKSQNSVAMRCCCDASLPPPRHMCTQDLCSVSTVLARCTGSVPPLARFPDRLGSPLTLYPPSLSPSPPQGVSACLVWGLPCRSHLHCGAVQQ